MKRREFLQTSGILLAAHAAAPNLVEAAEKRTPATTVAGGRRSLFFTTEAIARLRERLKTDTGVQPRWAEMLKRADALVAADFVGETEARQPGLGSRPFLLRYGEAGGQLSEMGMTLGLAYRMTGEERYAQKLRQALLHYAGYEQWCSPAFNARNPRWNSELSTAKFCFGAAVGYDALAEFLPAGERRQIARAIARLGILPTLEDWVLPGRRIHALDSMGHNWWAVCVGMAGVAALAVAGDDPRAPEWVDRVARGFEAWFGYEGNVLQNKPANFDAAGAFYESVGYADYALSEYLLFRLALANVRPNQPQPRFPALEKTGEFFAHTLYPTATSFLAVNFGDSRSDKNAAATMRLLQPTGFGSDVTRWYLRRMDTDSAHPLSLLHPPDGAASIAAVPTSVIYPDIGWAIMRDSWADDATMLAVKSGLFWNHAHADAGSFILYHAGRPLLIDSGACSYGRPEYRGYYTQSHAHNVILFNGQGQPEEDLMRGSKFNGRVHSLLDGLGVKYVYADATGPMARYLTRNYRHWLWLDGVILVFDDLLAHEEGKFDWLLHYAGEARHRGGEIEVTNGPAKARVTMLFPPDPRVHEEEGLAEREPEKKVTYLALSTRDAAREQKFVVAILPQPQNPAAPQPKVELLQEPLALGVRVRSGDQITDVYLNLQADGRQMHRNSNNIIAGWETDAYLFALTRPAASAGATPATVTRYFVSAGSYLRRDAQTVLDSLSKVTTTFVAEEKIEVLIDGQPQTDVAIFSAGKPATLVVNGQPTEFDHEPVRRIVRFRCKAI